MIYTADFHELPKVMSEVQFKQSAPFLRGIVPPKKQRRLAESDIEKKREARVGKSPPTLR